MIKLTVIIFTLFSLSLFADRNPATSQDPNDSTARSLSEPTKTGAGTYVLGLDCVACKAMETASQTKTLGDTSTIFRGGSSGSGSSGTTTTTSGEPVKTGN